MTKTYKLRCVLPQPIYEIDIKAESLAEAKKLARESANEFYDGWLSDNVDTFADWKITERPL